MQCLSCTTEIDPKWKHSIDTNVCPFCGKAIMDETLQQLLSSFSALFVELNNDYPEQLKDWLFSNYSYVIAKNKPTQSISSESKSNPFFENNGIKVIQRPDKTDKLKSIVDEISSDESSEFNEEEINQKLLHDLSSSKELNANSSSNEDDDPIIKHMMSLKKPESNGNHKDLATLQAIRDKAGLGKEAVLGGGKGAFRR